MLSVAILARDAGTGKSDCYGICFGATNPRYTRTAIAPAATGKYSHVSITGR